MRIDTAFRVLQDSRPVIYSNSRPPVAECMRIGEENLFTIAKDGEIDRVFNRPGGVESSLPRTKALPFRGCRGEAPHGPTSGLSDGWTLCREVGGVRLFTLGSQRLWSYPVFRGGFGCHSFSDSHNRHARKYGLRIALSRWRPPHPSCRSHLQPVVVIRTSMLITTWSRDISLGRAPILFARGECS